MKHILVFFFFTFFVAKLIANDSIITIKVHFIHGSKPKKDAKDEKKWFGGIHGGHVGIEVDSNKIFDFIRSGSTHLFSKKTNLHGKFVYRSLESFNERYKASGDSLERTIISIQISSSQKEQLDSLILCYTNQSPFDYAFFGMRCGAAAYHVLAQINVFPKYSKAKCIHTIFYPKKLRMRLLKKATLNNWNVVKIKGTVKRTWESDE